MASAAAASPSLSLNQPSHFQHQTSLITWLKPPSSALFRRKTLPLSSPDKRLSLPISASTSSSSSLSVSEKPTSNSVHFHGNLIESFEKNQDSFAGTINGASLIEELENPVERSGLSGRRRLFMQDPPWIFASFLKGLSKMVDQTVKIERKDIDK